MTATTDIDLEDLPIPSAVLGFDVTYQPAEPDVGLMVGGHEVHGEIISWRIGNLHLTRDQLVQAIGEDAVLTIEETECESLRERHDDGDFADDGARYDTYAEAAE